MDKASVLLSELGKQIGIPELAYDETGTCVLQIGDLILNLQLLPSREYLVIFSVLGEVPKDDSAFQPEDFARFYRILLEANSFFQHTQGTTIGIEKRIQTVQLQYQMQLAQQESPALFQFLNNFINIATTWQNWIRLVAKNPDLPPPSEEKQTESTMSLMMNTVRV